MRLAASLFATLTIVAATAMIGVACNGTNPTVGLNEPIRIANAQFYAGPIPSGSGPKVVEIDILNGQLPQGATGQKISGLAGPTARAIAMRLEDVGTGYWLLPVTLVDPQTNDLAWEVVVDLSDSVPPGKHPIALAAVDADGNFGMLDDTTFFLVQPEIPAGHVVVSLSWDSTADLDLHVIGPGGIVIDPKHPTTLGAPDGGTIDLTTPGIGIIDRDANSGCVQDGHRREDLVFQDAPAPGHYVIDVSEFASCGASATNLTVGLYVDGVLHDRHAAVLLDSIADQGNSTTFITEYDF